MDEAERQDAQDRIIRAVLERFDDAMDAMDAAIESPDIKLKFAAGKFLITMATSILGLDSGSAEDKPNGDTFVFNMGVDSKAKSALNEAIRTLPNKIAPNIGKLLTVKQEEPEEVTSVRLSD